MPAAAEALPAELDHGRRGDLSHTAFLERLLAVEVTATTARRQASLARFACLPAPWQLADFDFDAQPSVITASSSPSWAPCGSSTTPPTSC